MVKSQEWINNKYPKKENIGTISLERAEVEGELIIQDFPNLRSIELSPHNGNSEKRGKLTKLKLINCPKLTTINCAYNQLIELDLTDSHCSQLSGLFIQNNQLTSLDLSSLSNLTIIFCAGNKLTNLDLSNNKKVYKLWCSDDKLENISLPKETKNLRELILGNNNFPSQNLSFLSSYHNLEFISLGNNDKNKIQQNIYNRFHGSLEHLKNMRELKKLLLFNTDIDSGLEYLPLENLDEFDCSVKVRPESKIVKIYSLCQGNVEKIKQLKSRGELSEKEVIEAEGSSKKSKNAKRKEKLNTAQEQITQLQSELETERVKNISLEKKLENLQVENSVYKQLIDKYLQKQKLEINELEQELNNLKIQEAQVEISPKK